MASKVMFSEFQELYVSAFYALRASGHIALANTKE